MPARTKIVDAEFHLTREERAAAVEQWLPLVRKLAGRYMGRLGRYYEYDDLVSIGQLALWSASRTYETNHGATFGTYSFHAVHHAFEALVKRWRSNLRRGSRLEESFDETDEEGLPIRQIHSPDLTPRKRSS